MVEAGERKSRAGAPRLLVGAPGSGGGKTTFCCGLLQALVARGMKPAACKCGPDYIDPLFHAEVIGAFSRNLDLFFSSEEQVRSLVADSALRADFTLIEGAMGYYDGIAVSDAASSWDVARATETPAILVVDGRGKARSLAAEVAGYAGFKADSRIAGVVLNCVSPALYPRLAALIEEETGVAVYGYLPVLDDCRLESRHLGLVSAREVCGLRAKLDKVARVMEDTVDIDGLLQLAAEARALGSPAWQGVPAKAYAAPPLIAVAHDEAFCFYYPDTLRLLEHLGARLVEFSPLSDKRLPEGASGVYLGGGYPELHARKLSENEPMRAALAGAIGRGMPLVAECGGFMYLHEQLEDETGKAYPQVGAVPGTSFKTGKLGRFGYITLKAKRTGLIAAAGQKLPAHEFHYWDSESPGDAFAAQKPQSARSWECGISAPSLYAGYPHLYLPAAPKAAQRFVRACAAYSG